MSLSHSYPEKFLRLWNAWPKWPTGRSKKQPAWKAFEKADKELKFTDADIEELFQLIERMKTDRASWQKGSTYGPQGLQVWINQRGWQDDYEKVKTQRHIPGSGHFPKEDNRPPWEKKGMEKEAWERMNQQAADAAFAQLRKIGMSRR